MAKYHRKPQGPVEGFKWTGNMGCIPEWMKEEEYEKRGDRLVVDTRAGSAVAHINDHILRRKHGDCYVVEADNVDELFDIKED